MKRIISTLALPLALMAAAPAAAQDEGATPDMSNIMGNLFGDAFKAEPLTAEEEARIPQAEAVVAQIFPDGSFLKMMDETLKPMLDGLLGSTLEGGPAKTAAKLAGISEYEIGTMDDAEREEIMAIIDPAYKERGAAIQEVTFNLVNKMMQRIEPSYQAGLARAYAQRFTIAEMEELNRFFNTPVGSHYAAESMLIYSDPQVMSTMNEMMPAMFELLPDMMADFERIGTEFPAERKFDELSAAEKARLSALLSVPVSELEENAKTITSGDDDWGDDSE